MSTGAELDAATQEKFRIDFRTFMAVFAVMMASMLQIIDMTIVNVALPDMMGNLGATIDEITWVVTGYMVANVIVIPMTGWLQSRFGRKSYLTVSILVFTAASVFCGSATTLHELVFFRVVQGLGGGALMAIAQAVMIETFPPSKQGLGQAIFGVGVMLTPALGPTLGGWITDNFSWRWIFYINLPLGITSALLCMRYIENPPHLTGRGDLRADFAGIALLVVGIGALQTVLDRGHRLDWFDSQFIVALSVAAGLALVGFVIRELTVDEPIVDLRVLKNPSLAAGCALGMVLGLLVFGGTFLFPVYSQTVLGWTAWTSGMAMVPTSLATAASMFIVGTLVWKLGPRPLYLLGMGLFLVSVSAMARWNHLSSMDQILWPLMLRGLAVGAMFVTLSTASLRTLPTADVAKGSGLLNVSRQLGGTFGIAMVGTLLDYRTRIHRSYLGESVSLLDPVTLERIEGLRALFAARGFDSLSATEAAHRALDGMLGVQSTVLGFGDVYWVMALLCVVSLPLLVLLGRGSQGVLEEREAEHTAARAARAREVPHPEVAAPARTSAGV